MKRPLFVAAVISIFTAVILIYTSQSTPQYTFQHNLVMWSAFVSIILFLYLKLRKLSVFYLLILSVIPIILYSHKNTFSSKELLSHLEGNEIDSYFSVFKVIDKSGYGAAYIKDVNDLSGCGIYISTEVNEFMPQDIIHVRGILKEFDKPTNEGEFDKYMYYRSLGLMFKCDVLEKKLVKREEESIYVKLYRLKQRISGIYRKVFDESEYAVAEAIVLGDKSEVSEEVNDNYKLSGIAHLLAVSGLHMSVVGMLLYNLLKKLVHRIPAAIVSGLLAWCYLILTGNAISARRAAIMMICSILADVLGRNFDMLSALSLGCILMIFSNVYVIQNTGFLMSFSAIAGIIFIYPFISHLKSFFHVKNNKKKMIFRNKIADMLILSISIQLATLPVVLWSNYQIPVISVFLNLIVIPLAAVVMISGILTGVAGLYSIRAATFFAGGASYVLKLYDALSRISVKINNSVIVTGKPPLKSIMIYVAILLTISFFYRILIHKKDILNLFQKKIVYALFFLFLCVGLNGMRYRAFDGLTIKMLDVGQGDCIFVRTGEGMTFLFDGGSSSVKNVGKFRILPFLKSVKVRKLDYVVVSHCDEDHINGIVQLMDKCDNTFSIGTLVLPNLGIAENTEIMRDCYDEERSGGYGEECGEGHSDGYIEGHSREYIEEYINLISKAHQHGIEVVYLKQGDVLLNSETVIQCMHPCEGYNYNSSNDYSAIYYLKYGSFTMLFTGDAEEKSEICFLNDNKELLNNLKDNITILKCGHHGSKTSTSAMLLRKINPKIALISSGAGNKYGHPNKEVLQRLSDNETMALRTDELGQISIFCNKDGVIYAAGSSIWW